MGGVGRQKWRKEGKLQIVRHDLRKAFLSVGLSWLLCRTGKGRLAGLGAGLPSLKMLWI